MIGDTPYDWQQVAKPTPFDWSEAGSWADCNGDALEIGSTVSLMRDAVAFDERGVDRGIWDAGRVVRISAASTELNVVFFEGVVGSGWASGVLPADNVKLVRKTESTNAQD
jgi:hypothetical protein